MPAAEPNDWRPLYAARRAGRSIELALDIARRVAEPGVIERSVANARAESSEPTSIYWRPHDIAQGDAGIALMYGCFDACFPDQGWDRLAHYWIERAARGAESAERVAAGLFEGISGLAFAVHFLSRGGRRYRTLTQQLHDHVVAEAATVCAAFDAKFASGDVPFFIWDVVAGITGIGTYLLTRQDDDHLKPILMRLVVLTEEADGLPRWFTSEQLSSNWMRDSYPDGHLNCGLAHGIPGPLALMALASLQGIAVPGLEIAIDRAATWLSGHSAADTWGINWPAAVPLRRVDGRRVPADCDGLAGSHAGWCYGSPGVARAMWLAGRARGNAVYSGLAVAAMRAVMQRPPHVRGLSSPALCHGVAGLLCIALRFRHELADAAFTTFGRGLLTHLEDMYEPDTLLGYRTSEPGGGRIDQAGMLDGAPGIAMALLAAATPQPPSWDRLFLLS